MDSPTMSFSLAPASSAAWIEEAALSGAVSIGRANGAQGLQEAEGRLMRGLTRVERRMEALSSVLGIGSDAAALAPGPSVRAGLTFARVVRSEMAILADDARSAAEAQDPVREPSAPRDRLAVLLEGLARTNERLAGVIIELESGRIARDLPSGVEHFLIAAREECGEALREFQRACSGFRSSALLSLVGGH